MKILIKQMNISNNIFSTLFTLPGKPIPLARPRFTHVGASKVFDSQKKYKIIAANQLKLQLNKLNNPKKILEPIKLYISFFMPIPKCSKKKKNTLIGQPHHKKPDLSNLVKFVEDVASSILFKDDALIYSIKAIKLYNEKPRTEFYVLPIQESLNEKK